MTKTKLRKAATAGAAAARKYEDLREIVVQQNHSDFKRKRDGH
jgi:hypothetical protein